MIIIQIKSPQQVKSEKWSIDSIHFQNYIQIVFSVLFKLIQKKYDLLYNRNTNDVHLKKKILYSNPSKVDQWIY